MDSARLLSFEKSLFTPLIRDVPLQFAANAARGGNKSGQSVASKSKPCNVLPVAVMPSAEVEMDAPANLMAFKISLSGCFDSS